MTTQVGEHANRLYLNLFILCSQHVEFYTVEYFNANIVAQQLAVRSIVEEDIGNARDSVQNELLTFVNGPLINSFDETLDELLDFTTFALEALLSELLLGRQVR